ncbi:MAG: septum formation protein Maf [Armatimonadetes bacterium]|nr:septum formation protein Maf [Armatimonadota bacterium]
MRLKLPLVLASASPRRESLLRRILSDFEIAHANVSEAAVRGRSPEQEAVRLATAKAQRVFERRPRSLVLGADTLVCLGNQVIGKPSDREDAKAILQRLSGREHSVITGVCLLWPEGKEHFAEITRVRFRALSKNEIALYVATGEPMDKAGAYAIQGGASGFVQRVDGDLDNIIGLPLNRLAAALRECELLAE